MLANARLIAGQHQGYCWPTPGLLPAIVWVIAGQRQGYCWPTPGLLLANARVIPGQRQGFCRSTPFLLPANAGQLPTNARVIAGQRRSYCRPMKGLLLANSRAIANQRQGYFRPANVITSQRQSQGYCRPKPGLLPTNGVGKGYTLRGRTGSALIWPTRGHVFEPRLLQQLSLAICMPRLHRAICGAQGVLPMRVGVKCKVFYGHEPPRLESTTTECGVNYKLLQNVYYI